MRYLISSLAVYNQWNKSFLVYDNCVASENWRPLDLWAVVGRIKSKQLSRNKARILDRLFPGLSAVFASEKRLNTQENES